MRVRGGRIVCGGGGPLSPLSTLEMCARPQELHTIGMHEVKSEH